MLSISFNFNLQPFLCVPSVSENIFPSLRPSAHSAHLRYLFFFSFSLLPQSSQSPPAANTRRREPVPQSIAPQLIQNRNHEPRSARSAADVQRNRSAIHIRLVAFSPKPSPPPNTAPQTLHSLHAIHLLQAQPGRLNAFCELATVPIPMMLGSTPALPRNNLSNRLQSAPLAVFSRVTLPPPRRPQFRSHSQLSQSIFLKRRWQLLQNLHRRFRPPVIVFAHHNRLSSPASLPPAQALHESGKPCTPHQPTAGSGSARHPRPSA